MKKIWGPAASQVPAPMLTGIEHKDQNIDFFIDSSIVHNDLNIH